MKVVRFSVYESKTTWFEVPADHFDVGEIEKINSEKINLQDVTYKRTTKLSDILYGKTEVEYIQHEDVDVQEFALIGDEE